MCTTRGNLSAFRKLSPGKGALRGAECLLVLMVLSLISLACGPTDSALIAPKTADPPTIRESPQKDGPFTVTQVFEGPYAAGAENKASVTMTYDGTEPVTALALQITLPLGWKFGSLQKGAKPAIFPEEGATDTVTMVWIQAPDFPATLAYTVSVANWAEGTHTLEAQAIYRTLGGELHAPTSRVAVRNSP